MDWSIGWWVWIILGFGLALLELATPGGFYFLFFGISSLIIGVLSRLGALQEAWLQLMLFSILAVAASLLFRRPLLQRFGPEMPDVEIDSLVGEIATALVDIEVDGFGKVELRGTSWSARNGGAQTVKRGQRCEVMRVEGLSLWITG